MIQTGKILVIAGMILVIAGLIIWFLGDKLNWLGHLPGDIRIERENIRFYFPVTTMIVVSVILSLLLWLIRKLF
ncbi:MAG TPA: DUF2905 domain-containing protein [Bacteroidales bacterium]|nr:DUF2905 domain-containing protein [Bacteroidales bacterium]